MVHTQAANSFFCPIPNQLNFFWALNHPCTERRSYRVSFEANDTDPIHWGTKNGYVEFLKVLAPLIDDLNMPNHYGETPIYVAAKMGHANVIEILAPLIVDDHNIPNHSGITPIYFAAY